MRLGVVVEGNNWLPGFKDTFAELTKFHQVAVFRQRFTRLPFAQHRVNRWMLHRDLKAFVRSNDVVFFEWAAELLAAASHLPKKTRMVARLRRYELFDWASHVNWDNVDRIVLVSHAMKRQFTDLYPSCAEKSIVIHNGVSLDEYQLSSKEFGGDIGTLAHLTPRKRVYELILDFRELLRQGSFRLHIEGGAVPWSRDYPVALRALVERLGLTDKVTFYDHVTDPAGWYHKIDIFVLNSYSEGLPVALLEAMASGCYCLSHCWDGAEEVLPREHIFVSGSELQERVLAYSTKSEAARQELRKQMRAIVKERFDIKRVNADVRRVVEEAGGMEM